MRKTAPRPDFQFYVDPSCLTDSTDLAMPTERVASSQTIVHHDPWSEPEADKATDTNIRKEDTSKSLEDERAEYDEDQRARERQIDRIEAQIQAAARAVVASFEDSRYRGEESVLSAQTDESYNPENSLVAYEEGSALSKQTYETYDQENSQLDYEQEISHLSCAASEEAYETEDDHAEQEGEEVGDSSSHHDGDVEDDIFSHSEHSGRSSMNSCHDTSDETNQKELTSPVVGEEAAEPISRIPSATSYTPRYTLHTPSKGLTRHAFRNPSSVRAMQMSSPTPSIFSSPRSTKRHLSNVSRSGTPTSHSSFSPTKKTPTRFKAKKEPPLVLLHVTVLPLSWPYSRAISSPDLPPSLLSVKDNYRLLHEKLGDTVLERGILLPHPQDSYEVLEERLLEALELPVRPRARILKCGHYMGPDTPTSDEEGRPERFQGQDRKWCDICERDVKIEGSGMDGRSETRFRVKVYASNGLMRAGAWAAAWREMERIDVELVPFVEGSLAVELEDFAASVAHLPQVEEECEDDGFVDEEEEEEEAVEHSQDIDGAAINLEGERRAQEEELLRRHNMEEERLREIYGHGHPRAESRAESVHPPVPRPSPRRVEHGDSLPELLLAAFKVAMRDRKNVLICVLSVLVLLLAMRPGASPTPHLEPVIRDPGYDIGDVIAQSIHAVPHVEKEIPQPPMSLQEPDETTAAEVVLEEVNEPDPAVIVEANKGIPLEMEMDTESPAMEQSVQDPLPEEIPSAEQPIEQDPLPAEIPSAEQPIEQDIPSEPFSDLHNQEFLS